MRHVARALIRNLAAAGILAAASLHAGIVHAWIVAGVTFTAP